MAYQDRLWFVLIACAVVVSVNLFYTHLVFILPSSTTELRGKLGRFVSYDRVVDRTLILPDTIPSQEFSADTGENSARSAVNITTDAAGKGSEKNTAASSLLKIGDSFPRLTYGTAWKKGQTAELVYKALKAGFRHIDTACQPKHYHEAGVGEGWTRASEELGLTRKDFWLQTKYTSLRGQDKNQPLPYDPKASKEDQVRQSLATSLKNLQTDYVDSLVMHSPEKKWEDTLRVWKTMEELVDAGTVRQIGISNIYNPPDLFRLYEDARIKPAVVQNRFYGKTGYDVAIRRFCIEHGIEYQSFWTLSSHHFTGNERVKELAKSRKVSPETLLYALVMKLGHTPLDGTKTHMEEDLDLLRRIRAGEEIIRDEDVSPLMTILGAKEENPPSEHKTKIKGAFVFKVQKAKQIARTLCTLTKFFNHRYRYPIKVFSDEPELDSNSTLHKLQSYAGANVDIQIIFDPNQRWKEFPPELTSSEQDEVKKLCTNNTKEIDNPICTTAQFPLSYVYMGYWRYRTMPFEPALQNFDYIVSVDADAYFTRPITYDPFELMKKNDLVGLYTLDTYQRGDIGRGIQEAIDASFSDGEYKSRGAYFDDPDTTSLLDSSQKWNRRAFYGYFFGCQLNFLRRDDFQDYARRVIPYTYQYRTDEQAVIGSAWAFLEPGRVWYLPSHADYKIGLYHHGVVDDEYVLNCDLVSPPNTSTSEIIVHNSTGIPHCYWTLPFYNKVKRSQESLLNKELLYEQYVAASTFGSQTNGIEQIADCVCAQTKVNFVLRKACDDWQKY